MADDDFPFVTQDTFRSFDESYDTQNAIKDALDLLNEADIMYGSVDNGVHVYAPQCSDISDDELVRATQEIENEQQFSDTNEDELMKATQEVESQVPKAQVLTEICTNNMNPSTSTGRRFKDPLSEEEIGQLGLKRYCFDLYVATQNFFLFLL